MFIRVNRDFWQEDKNHNFLYDPTSKNVNGIFLNRINRGIALDEVHMFSPTLVLQFRYGVTAQEFPERRVSQGFDLTSLGFSPALRGAVPQGQGGDSQHQRGLSERAQRFGIGRRHGHLAQPHRHRQLHLDEGQSQRALRPGLPRLPRLQRPPFGRRRSHPQLQLAVGLGTARQFAGAARWAAN